MVSLLKTFFFFCGGRLSGFTAFQLPIFRISVAILSNSKYDSNCLEQVEALADETVRTGFRCEKQKEEETEAISC